MTPGVAPGYELKGEKTVRSARPLRGLCMGRFGLSRKTRFDDSGSEIFAIENGDETDADAFWTNGFTLILISARTESFSIHGF